jgi:hypothetical protein
MYLLIVALLAFFVALPASAQVAVDIGINLPAPPQLVVVPEAPSVQYVSTGDANLFFYGGQYWAYSNNGWYYSGGYNGPWIGVGPEFVPQPLLIVPVTYYRRPPAAWRGWTSGRPPQWGNNYGRSWSGKREAFVPRGQPPRAAHPAPAPARDVHAAPVQQRPAAEHAPERQEPAHAEAVKEQPRPQVREAPAAEHEKPAEHEEAHH